MKFAHSDTIYRVGSGTVIKKAFDFRLSNRTLGYVMGD